MNGSIFLAVFVILLGLALMASGVSGNTRNILQLLKVA